jgi:hypothetical protein
VQCAYISEDEVKAVAHYLRSRYKNELPDDINLGEGSISADKSIFSSSIDDEDKDTMYDEAKKIVIEEKKASTSYIQRRLKIGYSRAARILDELEEAGVVGPANGAKPREILADAAALAPAPRLQNAIPVETPRIHAVTMAVPDYEEDEVEEDQTFAPDIEEVDGEAEIEEAIEEMVDELPDGPVAEEKHLAREDDENSQNDYDENDKY